MIDSKLGRSFVCIVLLCSLKSFAMKSDFLIPSDDGSSSGNFVISIKTARNISENVIDTVDKSQFATSCSAITLPPRLKEASTLSDMADRKKAYIEEMQQQKRTNYSKCCKCAIF